MLTTTLICFVLEVDTWQKNKLLWSRTN